MTVDEYTKQEALDAMNLKITEIQKNIYNQIKKEGV